MHNSQPSKQCNNNYEYVRSFLLTSIFCFIIALMTSTLWPGDFLKTHLLISFGYGYSALICGKVIQTILPSLTSIKVNLLALLSALVVGSLHAYFWLQQHSDFDYLESLKPTVFLGTLFTAICFYFFHMHEQKTLANQALEVAKRKQSEQEKALILSQLNQLQSQIEPHFLFNTLANIQALIELDPKKANIMLAKLTELLRGTLTINRSSLTNLEQETQLLSAYLDIQQIRLGERLNYQIDNQVSDNISLPPFLIQPLVENAIQHGIEPSNNGGKLTISYKIIEQNLIVEISDSGLGLQENCTTKGNGISLNNIQERLVNLFEGQASLAITKNELNGVTSQLSIPLAQLTKLQEEQV
ncbi:MAG: sensor histidine kinase [Psychromonas sp.]|nr:sensor histidine kinase [Psychromonas sp.]